MSIWWAEKNQDGSYLVDIPKLLFSIILHELCIVEILHNCDKDGNKTSREKLIDIWKAEIKNLRRIDKKTCVRAMYHQFYNPQGSTREDYPERWKTAWDHINFLFETDLESAWDHLTEIATKEDTP